MADQFLHASPLKPTRSVRTQTSQSRAESAPHFVHADYTEWRDIWRSIRHAMIGEPAIKQHAKRYLPQLDGMDEEQYAAYLDRAVFFLSLIHI